MTSRVIYYRQRLSFYINQTHRKNSFTNRYLCIVILNAMGGMAGVW